MGHGNSAATLYWCGLSVVLGFFIQFVPAVALNPATNFLRKIMWQKMLVGHGHVQHDAWSSVSDPQFCFAKSCHPPLMFLEKCLNMLMYLLSLLRSCCFGSCTVGGCSQWNGQSWRKNCPPYNSCVAGLYCINISQISCHQEIDHQNIVINVVPIL